MSAFDSAAFLSATGHAAIGISLLLPKIAVGSDTYVARPVLGNV
jgi:hypothetical protein